MTGGMLDTLVHLDAANLGRVLLVPGVTVGVLVCGWMSNRLAIQPSSAPPRSDYVPPKHTHVLDWTRSQISLYPDGSIEGACCVAGCNEVVWVGPVGRAIEHLPEVTREKVKD
jgi:hypothetical protein